MFSQGAIGGTSQPVEGTKLGYDAHDSIRAVVAARTLSGVPFLISPAGSMLPMATQSAGTSGMISAMSMALPK